MPPWKFGGTNEIHLDCHHKFLEKNCTSPPGHELLRYFVMSPATQTMLFNNDMMNSFEGSLSFHLLLRSLKFSRLLFFWDTHLLSNSPNFWDSLKLMPNFPKAIYSFLSFSLLLKNWKIFLIYIKVCYWLSSWQAEPEISILIQLLWYKSIKRPLPVQNLWAKIIILALIFIWFSNIL